MKQFEYETIAPNNFIPDNYEYSTPHPLMATEFFAAHNGGKVPKEMLADGEYVSPIECGILMQKYAEYIKACNERNL